MFASMIKLAWMAFHDLNICGSCNEQKVSEYDMEVPQSHIADQPTAP